MSREESSPVLLSEVMSHNRAALMAPDGSFRSLFDKELQREWVREGCGFNKLHIWADHPGTYDAWDILPNYKDVEHPMTLVSPVRLAWADDYSAEFAVDFASEKSAWRMVSRLFRDLNAAFDREETTKEEIVAVMKDYLPSFEHIETGKSLDSKM